MDDGYVNKYGGEVKFRVELVDALRNYKDKGNVSCCFISCLIITISIVYNSFNLSRYATVVP